MTSLYADEDVDILLKPLLYAKGFSVFTTHEEQMLGRSDEEQLRHAGERGHVFLTHNRVHFERLHAQYLQEGKEHCGIIIATRRNVYELARRIARFLERNPASKLRSQVWYV